MCHPYYINRSYNENFEHWTSYNAGAMRSPQKGRKIQPTKTRSSLKFAYGSPDADLDTEVQVCSNLGFDLVSCLL